MNIRTLIIRFGIGTLVAASAAVSATDRPLDTAAAELPTTSSSSVSADITARHEQFVPDSVEESRREAARVSSELQLVDDMTRKLEDHLERRLASQLNKLI